MQTLRCATKDVLAHIAGEVAAGRPDMSYLAISTETGYSLPAVQAAVAMLEKHCYITIQRRQGKRPNAYALVSEQRRRLVAVGQVVGLLQ